jgi:hypothetical protein
MDVLSCLSQQFDVVILSTWDDELPEKIPLGPWDVVLNQKPVVAGYSHRNFQRFSTAAGLRRAAELGATHVLKWRTDMLPTLLDVAQLLAWSKFDVPPGVSSRLVTCAFRNLSVRQDWFSTLPDLFAFGDIDMMAMLWGDDAFDYASGMNFPLALQAEADFRDWSSRPDFQGIYCPEAELYALFKGRLQIKLGVELTHAQIAKKYIRLVDHQQLGICWFGEPGKFRSVTQALQHPWWTEQIWQSGRPQITELGYPEEGFIKKFRRKFLTPKAIKRELENQMDWYRVWSV